MKKFFCVNVSNYNSSYNFEVIRPSSIKNPRNESVMFVQEEYVDDAIKKLKRINHCLIFWPLELECKIPLSLKKDNVFVLSNDAHIDFCRFFKDNNITNIQKTTSFKLCNGAFIAKKAKLKEGVVIMPGAVIYNEVTIGRNVYIGSGVKIIGEAIIGDNVVIKENTVIGADGLTTDREEDGTALTMPQFGKVVIEDNVQIGSNCVIARGAIDETRIRKGAKIDNMCFISHNVDIGENTFVVGETIMFGSSSTGKNCIISGNSTVMNKVNIGTGSILGAGAVATKSIPNNCVAIGCPAKVLREVKPKEKI